VSVLVLVIDDEPDVEALFRQQFRRDLRAQRFVMGFAVSAADALTRIAGPIEQTLILVLSDINMPGMTGLEMAAKSQGNATGRPHGRRGETRTLVVVDLVRVDGLAGILGRMR
jgi:CheY-like chemotaxis protein